MPQSDRTRWDARHRERGGVLAPPDGFLAEVAPQLPRAGRALDVAGGTGRHALWLAEHGLSVSLCDISPVALEHAAAAAAGAGLGLECLERDLEEAGLPTGPWELILDFHYLWRPLFAEFVAQLAPGGLLLFVQPTRRNLERHAHPSARFLLEEGELPGLAEELETLVYDEGWSPAGRHEARLLARKP